MPLRDLVHGRSMMLSHCNLPIGGLLFTTPYKRVPHQHVCPLWEQCFYNGHSCWAQPSLPSHQLAKVEGRMEHWGTNDLLADWLYFVTCVPKQNCLYVQLLKVLLDYSSFTQPHLSLGLERNLSGQDGQDGGWQFISSFLALSPQGAPHPN